MGADTIAGGRRWYVLKFFARAHGKFHANVIGICGGRYRNRTVNSTVCHVRANAVNGGRCDWELKLHTIAGGRRWHVLKILLGHTESFMSMLLEFAVAGTEIKLSTAQSVTLGQMWLMVAVVSKTIQVVVVSQTRSVIAASGTAAQ